MTDMNQPTEIQTPEVVDVPVDQLPVDPAPVEQPEQEVEQKSTDSTNVAKRIAKLSKKLADKEAEIERLKQQQVAPVTNSVQAEQPNDGRPKFADYDNVESYTEAMADWKYEERQKASQAAAAQSAQLNEYYTRVRDFSKSTPDFQLAVQEIESELNKDPGMVEFILESEFGPQVAYHLANNEDEIERLSKMSPTRRIAALSKIETEMANRKPVTPSSAPSIKQPASRVTGNTGSVVQSASVNKDASFAEWKKWRQQSRK